MSFNPVVPAQFAVTVLTVVIMQGRWPEIDPATLRGWAADHRTFAQQLTEAADVSVKTYRPLFHELLQGQAGDALQTSLASVVGLWLMDAKEHRSAATALDRAADYVKQLQSNLTDLINFYTPMYETAVSHNQDQGAMANAILKTAESVADTAVQKTADAVFSVLNGAFGYDAPPI
jgi:hypothetical protein